MFDKIWKKIKLYSDIIEDKNSPEHKKVIKLLKILNDDELDTFSEYKQNIKNCMYKYFKKTGKLEDVKK